jgi:hypothetical protein
LNPSCARHSTLFLSPEFRRGFYWGIGPVIYFPTATNRAAGVNKWGSDPPIVFAWEGSRPWVVELVTNNIWSFGGPPQGSDKTNSLLVNPIVSYHLAMAGRPVPPPVITADWNKAPSKRWTVPVGGGLSKVVKLGGHPVKFSIDLYDDVVHPQGTGLLWTAQFTVTFLFAR